MKHQDEMLHPIFVRCSCLTKDKFWISIFEDLAYNKTPLGSYIKNNALYIRGTKSSVLIDTEDVEKTYDNVYGLFTQQLYLMSPLHRLEMLDTYHEKIHWTVWKDVRGKNNQNLLIELFSVDMMKKYKLTLNQAKILQSNIHTGILFKSIDKNNITMLNGRIFEIDGIYFDVGNVKYDETLFDFDLVESSIAKPKYKLMCDLWGKYINKKK